MKIGSKHTTDKTLSWMDFSGGLNISTNIESIAENELSQADNVEFGLFDKGLCPVPGLEKVYTSTGTVKVGWYDSIHSYNLLIIGYEIFRSDLITQTKIGNLTGLKDASFIIFNNKIYIASGSKLQCWDGTTLTTVDSSPNADMMFVKYGRLLVANSGDDYVFMSKVGDATDWNFLGTAEDDAKRIEIGYLDDYDISAMIPVSQDFVIFKKHKTEPKGRVFRLQGWYPDWEVLQIAEDVHCMNPRCVVTGFNDSYYLGAMGFSGLKTVQEYGSVRLYEAGAKVNSELKSGITVSSAKMWHLPSKQQILIQSATDKRLWIYHYLVGEGAFTTRLMPYGEVQDIWTRNSVVYVSILNSVYIMREGLAKLDGVDMKQVIRSKRWLSPKSIVIKYTTAQLYNTSGGTGNITISGLSLPLRITNASQLIYGNTNQIFGNTGDIWQSSTTKLEKRPNFVVDAVEIKITINSGGASLRNVNIGYAEVG